MAIPAHLKIRSGQGKWILRQLLARYLPKSLFERPKMGFAIPVDAWLRNPLRDWAEAMLDPSRLDSHGLLDTEVIRRCWHEHVIEGRQWSATLGRAHVPGVVRGIIQVRSDKEDPGRRMPTVMMLVNVSWFFVSHRLQIALGAMGSGFIYHLATRFAPDSDRNRLRSLGIETHDVPFARGGANPVADVQSLFAIFGSCLTRPSRPFTSGHAQGNHIRRHRRAVTAGAGGGCRCSRSWLFVCGDRSLGIDAA